MQTELSKLIDESVFDSKQNCAITYTEREGKLNCNLCKDVYLAAKSKDYTEKRFINCYPGAGVNYETDGLVILTNSPIKSDFKLLSPSVGELTKRLLTEYGIKSYYALPTIKCELETIGLSGSPKIRSTCGEVTDGILKHRLKPRVILTDDVATFNQLISMRFMSAGKVVNHVMWSAEHNCYVLLCLNLHMLLAEATQDKKRRVEEVKLESIKQSFKIVSSILSGDYQKTESIIRVANPEYSKIDFNTPEEEVDRIFALIRSAKKISMDIETEGLVEGGGLKPWDSRVTMLAIGYGIGKAVVFPWSYVMENRARFQEIFSNPNIIKILANGAFDISHMTYAGFTFVGPFVDILVYNYLYRNGIDYDQNLLQKGRDNKSKSRDTNTLKFLSRCYTDLGAYDKVIKEAGGIVKAQAALSDEEEEDNEEFDDGIVDKSSVYFEDLMRQEVNPDSKLRLNDANDVKLVGETKTTELNMVEKYNAQDADATLRVELALDRRLQKQSALLDFYRLLMEPLIFEVIVPIFLQGIKVDMTYLHGLEVKYHGDTAEDGTVTLGEMQVIERRWIDSIKKELKENTLITTDVLKDIYKKETKEYAKKNGALPATKEEFIDAIPFNINSPTKILKVYKALGVLAPDAKSVDADVLTHMSKKLGIESAQHKADYQPVAKLYKTYVKAIKDLQVDGFIHCIFNTFFTATGRLCVSGDTLLSTSAGNFRIDEFDPDQYPGATILTHLGNQKKILRRYYKGEEMMYKVEVKTRETITCTLQHRLRTSSGWKHLSELGVGYSVHIHGPGPNGEMYIKQRTETIKSITEAGVQAVWDIEVEDDHSYVAQGFINHNSSSNPNMQNIPADNTIKNIFVPREGYSFLDYDYSQAELRVIAEYAEEQTFIDAYLNDRDLHWDMTQKMFNIDFPYAPDRKSFNHVLAVAKHIGTDIETEYNESNWGGYVKQEEEKTFEFSGNVAKVLDTIKKWAKQRGYSKTLNFSILYGSSAFGLARNIYADTYDYVTDTKRQEYIDECEELLQTWFKTVPNIKKWLDENFAFAQKHGYVTTIYGRRRYLSFANSNYWKFMQAARREAGNTPIQSTASDICCLAAIEFQRFIRRPENIADDCRIVNIVHDNILAEVPDEKADYYAAALKDIMENKVNPLKKVPLKADGKITKRWVK